MGHVDLDYNQITDLIYVGSNLCCATHFEEELLEKGIEADISLEKEHLDNPVGVDYFLWLPTLDHEPPTQKQLRMGVAMLKQCIAMNMKVYVHCKNGHGRAPSLVAAYLMTTGMDVQEALSFIKEKRPPTHLQDVQVAALEEFKKNI